MNDFAIAIIATFFSVAPAMASITVRESVKQHRQSIIRDLAKFFKMAAPIEDHQGVINSNNEVDLLHSFEFVKFKYFLGGQNRDAEADLGQEDFRLDQWVTLSLPLILLLLLMNLIFMSGVIVSFGLCSANSLPECFLKFLHVHRTYRFVLLASYGGAYVYMLRAFFQAINNFDLTPASFIGAFNNLVFGLALPQVAFFAPSIESLHNPIGLGSLIITSFVGGYMPDTILRYLLGLSIIKYFKEEKFDFGDRGKSISIEALDGIDSFIRFKLSDFHINTVQNLACANPIMLFVETPYGIYQMIDWVAQAQLCASVGPDALFKLWDLGIRTIFDLERAVLHKEFENTALSKSIQKIILPADIKPKDENSGDTGPIIQNVRVRVDSVYTQRLRQIVNCVADQLGSQRLRDIPVANQS